MKQITPHIIAHRGASAYAPENTRASFLKAKILGAKWVEFDVRLTSDDQVVVFHDETLERITNGKGEISNHTLKYLKTLDAGSWFDPAFYNEKILTLKETLLLLQENQLAANIELKSPLGQELQLAEAVMRLLSNKLDIPVLISSFNPKAIDVIRSIHSTIPLAYLMDEWTDEWKGICDKLRCVSVNITDSIATPEHISTIKRAGYAVMVYTVNQPSRAKSLFEAGVNAVFTDFPDIIENEPIK